MAGGVTADVVGIVVVQVRRLARVATAVSITAACFAVVKLIYGNALVAFLLIAAVSFGGSLESFRAFAVVVERAVAFKPGAVLGTLLAVVFTAVVVVGPVHFGVRVFVAGAGVLVRDALLWVRRACHYYESSECAHVSINEVACYEDIDGNPGYRD